MRKDLYVTKKELPGKNLYRITRKKFILSVGGKKKNAVHTCTKVISLNKNAVKCAN